MLVGAAALQAQGAPANLLWYNRLATDWEKEALPIGNGRLGAMLFGRAPEERIQFNEESLWIGDETDTGAYQAFGDVFVALAHGPVTEYRRELSWCEQNRPAPECGRFVLTPLRTRPGHGTAVSIILPL